MTRSGSKRSRGESVASSSSSRAGGTDTDPNPKSLQILEAHGRDSFNPDKKKNKAAQFEKISRECPAVNMSPGLWMDFTKKWCPVAVYDSEGKPFKSSGDKLEIQMEIAWYPKNGRAKSSVQRTYPHGLHYWFRGVEFSTPGDHKITYSCTNAERLGLEVAPLVIPVKVTSSRKSGTATSSPGPVKPKKKTPPTPPTPSTATTTRRATGSIPSTPKVPENTESKSPVPKKRKRGRPSGSSNASISSPVVQQKVEESIEECSRLERTWVLDSIKASGSNPVEGLEDILPPVLQIALLDDVHDVFQKDIWQNELNQMSKKQRKAASNDTASNPTPVFQSAAPSPSSLKWSVYSILHDSQFESFILERVSKSSIPVKSRKQEVTRNINTLLVAFETLCHNSNDWNTSITSSSIFYNEERNWLNSSGFLSEIKGTETGFLYHHCNARHLLRASVLLLLKSPKHSKEKRVPGANTDNETLQFYDFVENVVAYLAENAYPLLCQD